MSFLLSAFELIHIFVYIEAAAVIGLQILGIVLQDLVNEENCAQELCTPAEGNVITLIEMLCLYTHKKMCLHKGMSWRLHAVV